MLAPSTEHKQPAESPVVRLGIMLDSFDVPGWLYYLLERIRHLQSVELALVIMRSGSRRPADRSPILFRAWAALDRRIRRSSTDALRPRDCRALLTEQSSVPILFIAGERPLNQNELLEVQAAELDVLLDCSDGALDSGLLDCAHLGLWSVECGSSPKGRDGELWNVPGSFREMCNGETVFNCGLSVMARTRQSTTTLFRGSGITNFLSLALNQNTACWKAAAFLLAQLSAPHRLQSINTGSPILVGASSPCPKASALSNREMSRFLARWAKRELSNEVQKRFFREQWFLALRRRTGSVVPADARGFTIIKPPRSRFYADPFLFERNGRTYLFFEDYPFALGKGLISCCELQADGSPSEPRVVLERDYHLSYPFLFEHHGEVYMIPETQDNRTIEMYRAKEFPYSWEFHKVLMQDVAAADTTLLQHHGKWWLFTAGVLDSHSLNDMLCVFFSDSPFGPWKAHPKNPVISDPRRARPAGCLYLDNGELIRPGQDCSNGYGYAVQLHRVERLTETEYEETPLKRITPDWIPDNRGTHTLNQTGTYQVLDARSLISRFHIPRPFPSVLRNREIPSAPVGARTGCGEGRFVSGRDFSRANSPSNQSGFSR